IKLHDRAGIEKRDILQALDARRCGTTARVDENLVGSQRSQTAIVQPNLNRVRTCEAGLAFQQSKIPGLLNASQSTIAKAIDNALLSSAHCSHVHCDRSGVYAVVCRTTREVSYSRAVEHGLGRRASDVNTCAADRSALNDCGFPA